MKRLLLTLLCLLALLAGCGGSDSPSNPSTGIGSTSTPKQKPDSSKTTPSTSLGGGERSVQGFGSEASGSEREAALSTFHAFLGAIASRDYPAACAHLSKSVIASLKQLASSQLHTKGCEATLPKLLAPSAAPIAAQQNEGEVTRVRVKGNQAFVLYHAPGARLYVLTLVREGGDWKSSNLSASVLVPSAATLGLR